MRLKLYGPLLILGLALASCSQEAPEPSQSEEASTDAAARAPDIGPTAAPGVAFSYDYEFQLADDRISPVQEAHARACEQLGLARCRITGMAYRVDENEQVSGTLSVKLDPAIARSFGKQAWTFVEKNDGRLVNLAITGDDVGSGIDAASRRRSELTQRLADLERRLAALRPSDPARGTLISQIEGLRQEIAGQQQTIETGRAQLASTPMTFEYYGSGGVPGFRGNPMREAWHTLVATIVVTVRVLLQVLAVVLPLALILGLLLLVWRSRPLRALRGWLRPDGPTET